NLRGLDGRRRLPRQRRFQIRRRLVHADSAKRLGKRNVHLAVELYPLRLVVGLVKRDAFVFTPRLGGASFEAAVARGREAAAIAAGVCELAAIEPVVIRMPFVANAQ